MTEINDAALKEIEDNIRNTINWIKIFEEEYNLPKEVVDELRKRLEGIATKLGMAL